MNGMSDFFSLASLHVLSFDQSHRMKSFFNALTLEQDSIMSRVVKISLHKRQNCDRKKEKAKGWGELHAGYQNGRASCLFPPGEFKACGVSDNLSFSLLLPFGSIILGCLISDGKEPALFFVHFLSSGCDPQTDQLSTKRHSVCA